MLRFQFLSTKLGPFIVESDDPIGINELTKTIKRSAEHEGIVFEVVFDLEFIKGSRFYLKQCFETDGGVDALVIVNIYKDNPNTRKWVLYTEGTVNFNKYDLYEDKLSINIEQTGTQRRVTNLMDTDVNLETIESENGNALPPVLLLPDMLYHSKTIVKETKVEPSEFIEHQDENVSPQDLPPSQTTYRERVTFGQMDTSKQTLNDLPEIFNTQFGYTDLETLGITDAATPDQTKTWLLANPTLRELFNVARFDEAGKLDIDLKIKTLHQIIAHDPDGDINVCDSSALGEIEVYYWLELRSKDNEIKLLNYLGQCDFGPCNGNDDRTGPPVDISYSLANVDIKKDDKLYWYHTIRIYGHYQSVAILSKTVDHTFRITPQEGYAFNLSSQTSSEASTAKTILLYEAIQRCLQYYTNELDCFYSDLLARTDIQLPGAVAGELYPSDGEAALIGWTNGANLRGLDKPIFASLATLLDFVNSVFCIGFGFEIFPDGKQRFRLEKRSHFYDKDNKILSLGPVYNIRKSIDTKRYYNQIEFGYLSKIDIGQTNAIDAFNTVRRNTIPIVNTKNQLKVGNKVKADGYQIEAARRLRFTTADGKNDDEPFVVVVIREGESFRSKRDEGYELIENVVDSPTGYNYDISPARALRNWFKIIGSALIYSKSKIIKFSFGEVNFLMRTKKFSEDFIVEENGNIDLTDIEPDYDNFMYYLDNVDISDDLVQAICDNPYGYIEFEDRFGEVMGGYVSDTGIEHDSNKGKADFKLLKVFRK